MKKSFDMAGRGRYYAPRSNDSSVVQSVERRTVNPYVTGSSPVRGARFKKPAQGNLSGFFIGYRFLLAALQDSMASSRASTSLTNVSGSCPRP